MRVRRLIRAAEQLEGYLKNGIKASGWWKSFLMAMYDTAERRGALEQATWSDLDIEKRTLTLPAEVRKGRFADKVHRLKPETIAEIESITHPPRKYIWPWPQSPSVMYDRFGDLIADAGLPRETRQKFHRIRRSTATHVKMAGGNATEALGHSSEQLTKQHYLDPTLLQTESPADLLPSLVSAPTETDLSDPELKIVQAMLAGMSDEEIFQWAGAYPSHHAKNLDGLYKKLGTSDRDKIIAWATEVGIKPMPRDQAERGNSRGGEHTGVFRRSAMPHLLPHTPKPNKPAELKTSDASLSVLPLTEKRVAAALVCGMSVDQIGAMLGCDIISVANVLTSIEQLTGLGTQMEIAHWAESVGLGADDCALPAGGNGEVAAWM